jgi:hypothetical protein
MNTNDEFISFINPELKVAKLLNLEKMFNELDKELKISLWDYLQQLHHLSKLVLNE